MFATEYKLKENQSIPWIKWVVVKLIAGMKLYENKLIN